MKPIIVSYSMDIERLRQANRALIRGQFAHVPMKTRVGASIALVNLVFVVWLLSGRQGSIELFIKLGTTILATAFTMAIFLRISTTYQFKRSPLLGTKYTFVIDESAIEADTPLTQSRLLWEAFSSMIETERGFLLITNPNHGFWLPVMDFGSADGPERFELIAREKVKNYVRLGRVPASIESTGQLSLDEP